MLLCVGGCLCAPQMAFVSVEGVIEKDSTRQRSSPGGVTARKHQAEAQALMLKLLVVELLK